MYSIRYLYHIRNNFAIIYRGFDKDLLESLKNFFHEQKNKKDINLFLFINDDNLDEKNNIYHANMFSEMRHNFAKYLEIPKNSNKEYCINKIL